MAARRGVARDLQREQFWRRMVRRQAGSGRTVREFCAAENLLESAFYFWRRELERRQHERRERRTARSPRRRHAPAGVKSSPAAAGPTPFVPVEVLPTPHAPGPSTPRLEIVLPSGVTLHVPSGFDRTTLASVLDALEDRRC